MKTKVKKNQKEKEVHKNCEICACCVICSCECPTPPTLKEAKYCKFHTIADICHLIPHCSKPSVCHCGEEECRHPKVDTSEDKGGEDVNKEFEQRFDACVRQGIVNGAYTKDVVRSGGMFVPCKNLKDLISSATLKARRDTIEEIERLLWTLYRDEDSKYAEYHNGALDRAQFKLSNLLKDEVQKKC